MANRCELVHSTSCHCIYESRYLLAAHIHRAGSTTSWKYSRIEKMDILNIYVHIHMSIYICRYIHTNKEM